MPLGSPSARLLKVIKILRSDIFLSHNFAPIRVGVRKRLWPPHASRYTAHFRLTHEPSAEPIVKKLIALSLTLALPLIASADFADAKRAFDKGDYATALAQATPLAKAHHADAENLLGEMYASGLGVPKDFTKAIALYRQAAAKGDGDGLNNMGMMFATGRGVDLKEAEAVKWFRKAALKGNVNAMYNMGDCFYRGFGINQDFVQAMRWYRQAADHNDPGAQYHVGRLYERGEGVAVDPAQAFHWYSLSADQGLAQAQNALALLYTNGRGVPVDNVSAYQWAYIATWVMRGSGPLPLLDVIGPRLNDAQRAEAVSRANVWLVKHHFPVSTPQTPAASGATSGTSATIAVSAAASGR